MKVRNGSKYRYVASMWDRLYPPLGDIKDGDIVKVENQPGCPKANVMNCCYVVTEDGARFIGLVSCDSLFPKNISLANLLMGKKNNG